MHIYLTMNFEYKMSEYIVELWVSCDSFILNRSTDIYVSGVDQGKNVYVAKSLILLVVWTKLRMYRRLSL